jgi:hypothetical protein
LPTLAPHPVQPNSKLPGHGHFGNSFFPARHATLQTIREGLNLSQQRLSLLY